jgi:hypothetical protein
MPGFELFSRVRWGRTSNPSLSAAYLAKGTEKKKQLQKKPSVLYDCCSLQCNFEQNNYLTKHFKK